MAKKDSLGDRMKENYENRSKTYLTRRMPVIIRIDGKAFHSYTRGFSRPYDEVFHEAMNETTKRLCENIQGCKFAYTQSDEISLLLTDYDTLTTDAWFDYSVQKLCSVSASMASTYFNKAFVGAMLNYLHEKVGDIVDTNTEEAKLYQTYCKSYEKGAMFDARCFNIPKEEVCNYFIWRQQDATRNAVEILGRCYFSDKELHKKNNSQIQDMLMLEKNVNFNDMPIEFKRGICICKNGYTRTVLEGVNETVCFNENISVNSWVVDKNIPIFTQDREYVERWI